MLSTRAVVVGMIATLAASACAQTPFLSNASTSASVPALNAQGVTFSGVGAQSGYQWSELPALSVFESNATGGVACHSDSTGGLRIADDVVLTQPATLSEVWVYAYQPGWTQGQASPVAGATLRIWQGQPGQAGSTIVFGDDTTNRMIASDATNILRVFTTRTGPAFVLPSSDRAIYRVRIAASLVLQPGTYWLDWQLQASTPNAVLFAPTATLAAARTASGWNGLQWAGVDGAWSPVSDPAKPLSAGDAPQDFAFILAGTPGPICDSVDFNNDTLTPDSGDLDDFLSVLAGGPSACSTFPAPGCNDIDFNNDELFPDSGDLDAFVSRLSGGPCL